MTDDNQTELFEFAHRPVIKGFPELRWTGKHPYTSTQYFPAQLKESYGEPVNGWMNKLFWGDNLQVMSHLLKNYRGKVDLIYIDPPFDSKEDYKKRIKLRGKQTDTDSSVFEEKQYGDLWSSDEYLQFMYERLVLLRELLSDAGSIYLHCDWHKSHYLRLIMDDVFGINNFKGEIIWHYRTGNLTYQHFQRKHDTIFFYAKNEAKTFFNQQVIKEYHSQIYGPATKLSMKGPNDFEDKYGEYKISQMDDVWDISAVFTLSNEHNGYPTQKPESLLERIIRASSKPGDLIFDCFMGSGTTLAVAMKTGRRFIGSDINMGAISTTIKRLISTADRMEETRELTEMSRDIYKGEMSDDEYEARMKLKKCDSPFSEEIKYTGFEVYNVNNYDFFRNPIEARELIIQALDIQKLNEGNVYDGELDGRMVKILPTNRIATKADLNDFVSHLPIKTFEERKADNPNQPVERITLVCMGHEPDLKASLESELAEFKLDVEICDILRDKSDLQFKHDAEAEVVIEGDDLVIKSFYPLNLMQKLSLDRTTVNDWKELTDSILIDWNYDGAVLEPAVQDIPGKSEFVTGRYTIPSGAGTIKVKITDVLSESIEVLVEA